MSVRYTVLAMVLAGCGNQFEATYDLGGSYTFDEHKFNTGGCSDAFLAELEAGVVVTGAFPEFGSSQTKPGTITIAGVEIPIEIDAATLHNTSKGSPTDTDVTYTAGDGTQWSLEDVSFEAKSMCSNCKDQIVVNLFSTQRCAPGVVYLVD